MRYIPGVMLLSSQRECEYDLSIERFTLQVGGLSSNWYKINELAFKKIQSCWNNRCYNIGYSQMSYPSKTKSVLEYPLDNVYDRLECLHIINHVLHSLYDIYLHELDYAGETHTCKLSYTTEDNDTFNLTIVKELICLKDTRYDTYL